MIMDSKTILGYQLSPNVIYQFHVIPNKIPASDFIDFNKFITQFIWRGKRLRIGNTIFEEGQSWRTDAIQLQDRP